MTEESVNETATQESFMEHVRKEKWKKKAGFKPKGITSFHEHQLELEEIVFPRNWKDARAKLIILLAFCL